MPKGLLLLLLLLLRRYGGQSAQKRAGGSAFNPHGVGCSGLCDLSGPALSVYYFASKGFRALKLRRDIIYHTVRIGTNLLDSSLSHEMSVFFPD